MQAQTGDREREGEERCQEWGWVGVGGDEGKAGEERLPCIVFVISAVFVSLNATGPSHLPEESALKTANAQAPSTSIKSGFLQVELAQRFCSVLNP